MTRLHRDAVLELCPQKLNSTFTLKEAAQLISWFDVQEIRDLAALRSRLSHDDKLNIDDPIGQPSEVFSHVGSQINELIEPVLRLIAQTGTPAV
jgi:protein-tyrosine phosphatase